MKKICFYVNYIFTIGGIQKVVISLANELCKDYDVTIIYKNNKKNKEIDYIDERIKLVNINGNSFIEKTLIFPVKLIHKILKKFNFDKKNAIYYKLFVEQMRFIEEKKIINYINENNFDYVLIEGINNCISFAKIKKRIKSKLIGCWHASFDNHSKNYPRKLIINSIKKLDQTIVLSKLDVNKIKLEYDLNVKYIYNPIIKNKNVNNMLKENKFIAVGRYAQIKQFDRLIEAFNLFNKQNKNWTLEIVGEGPERNNLQNLINKYELNEYVKLTGASNSIEKYYETSKILLMTSKDEGFGMVVVEAMQYGLAIISYDIPVLHEIMPQKKFYIENGNIEKLAEEMLKYSNNNELIKQEGKKNKKISEIYKIDNITKQWKEILK